MSHQPTPVAPFLPPTATVVGGEGDPPTIVGGEGPPALGGDGSPPGDVTTVGETALPFTGSVFTAPIAFLGFILTLAGWLLLRLGLRED